MNVWQAGLLAILGVAALIAGVRLKGRNRWMVAVATVGALLALAALAYLLLTYLFLGAASQR